MRHNWTHNKPKKGYSTCSNCDLSVKTYRIQKGGLPRCDPINALKPKAECRNHMKGAVAGARQCWHCGLFYTSAESAAGKLIMEQLIEDKLLLEPENPPPIPL